MHSAAETLARVGLPHVPVAAHCAAAAAAAAAAGRQGCSVVCSWGLPRSLLCCCIELSVVFRRKKKWCRYVLHDQKDDMSEVSTYLV